MPDYDWGVFCAEYDGALNASSVIAFAPQTNLYVTVDVFFSSTDGPVATDSTDIIIVRAPANNLINAINPADYDTTGALQWWDYWSPASFGAVPYDERTRMELVLENIHQVGVDTVCDLSIYQDGTLLLSDPGLVAPGGNTGTVNQVEIGQRGGPATGKIRMDNVRISAVGRGLGELFSDDFESGTFAGWTLNTDGVIADSGNFGQPTTSVIPSVPTWRWMLTDLDGTIITLLDKHVHDRTIDYRLDVSTRISGRVASADTEINRLWTDGFPNLAEGDRLLYCFRRDYDGDATTNDPWTVRAAGTILQLNDVANEDTANTEFTAYDPWQILYRRPLVNPNDPILGNLDYTYDVYPINDIIIDLLDNMALFNSPSQPGVSAFAFLDWGQTGGSFTGTIETLATVSHTFQKETFIGACLDELCALGNCDIWMEPIWDPVNRPGYTHQLNVYARQGVLKPPAVFGWDKPLRSTTGVNRAIDGTQRANNVRFHLGQGGPSSPSTIKAEGASIARFGEYWDTQFWVAADHTDTLSDWAQELIDQVSEHQKTVTIDVTPERCPDPFTEWFLGDSVRVFASNNLRATQSGFQRVVAFTLNISDNALETVTDLEIYIPQANEVFNAPLMAFNVPELAALARRVGTQSTLRRPLT